MTITYTPSTSTAGSTTSSPSPTAAAVITTPTPTPTTGTVAVTSTATTSSAAMPFTTTTTTRTTTSSTSFIKPMIALRAPSTIIGNTVSCITDYDDDLTLFAPSFSLGIYGRNAASVHVANNGYIATGPTPSAQAGYVPSALSTTASPTPNAHFLFWDDLFFQKGDTHGIFYRYEVTAPNRPLTFEWYGTKYSQKGSYFAYFLLSYYEALPSWTTYDYLNMTDLGVNATVSVKSNTSGEYIVPDSRQDFLGKVTILCDYFF